MPFSFSGPILPITVRACRSLMWAQAALTMLSGVFVVLVAVLFGTSESIPFHGATLSGGGAVLLGLVYVVAGLALVWLGLELGRLAPWARTAIVSFEMFLVVVQVFRSFDVSLSLLINVGLCIGIIALLFAPETQRALQGTAPG
jgi:hypothetical protein